MLWTLRRVPGSPVARRMRTSLVPTHSCGGGRRMKGCSPRYRRGHAAHDPAYDLVRVRVAMRMACRPCDAADGLHPAVACDAESTARETLTGAVRLSRRGVRAGRNGPGTLERPVVGRTKRSCGSGRAASGAATLRNCRGAAAPGGQPARGRVRAARMGSDRSRAAGSRSSEATGSAVSARTRIRPPWRCRAPARARRGRAEPAPGARAGTAPAPPARRGTPGRSPHQR